MNFWKQIPKPIFALAPMEDVTDTVFREVVESTASPGKLHIVFTEFLSVDGFLHDTGKEKVSHRLYVSARERELLVSHGIRLVAQIWGSDPEKFYRVARTISAQYDFDGIDINMGCPVRKIIKNNACSGLIKVPELAREIVVASREGSGLPVSVKTRIGFNDVATEEWIGSLLEVNPAAITVHGRTQKMKSEGSADWNEVRKAVKLRNTLKSETVILGNGDVSGYADGLKRAETYETDGIMVGRGIFRNPSFFAEPDSTEHALRLMLLKNHIRRFSEEWEGEKNPAILKRFFKIYLHTFENATRLRNKLMQENSYDEWLKIIEKEGV